MEFKLSPEEYVERLYAAVLRRPADPDGAALWASVIRLTGDPTLVLSGFMASDEYARLSRSVADTALADAALPLKIPDINTHEDHQGLNHCGFFIPTRDSSLYVGTFLSRLRALGIEPLYIVDARSEDSTLELLRAMGASFKIIAPEGSFGVTELVEAACVELGTNWVMRLDDDELPNKQLLSFLSKALDRDDSSIETYQFSREWLTKRSGTPYFFRSWVRWNGGTHYDLQRRVFKRSRLRFDHQIHTSGIVTDGLVATAPDNCFLAHFDSLIKTQAQRLAKMRRYESITSGSAWIFAELYLSEVYRDEAFLLHQKGLSEFDNFIVELPALGENRQEMLTADEVRKMAEQCPASGFIR